ncbi:MAG: sensor histidine kinase [Nitriliruptorales bacterium]
MTRHTFYVPVLIAALRFGPAATGVVALAAAVLAGPLAPGDPTVDVWLTRGAFFLGVGELVAIFSRGMRETIRTDIDLLERERALAGQRAAVLQTVSHEFRTPLTVIRGAVTTLRRRPELLDDRLKPLVDSLDRATERLSEMVFTVLASADRLDEEAPRRLAGVKLDGVAKRVARAFDDPQASRIRTATSDLRVVTVEPELRMILHCLVDNALKFSPPAELVEISGRRIGDQIRIEVRDHGPGLPPDAIERMFEPFVQSDSSSVRQHGGLGIGLFTARRLANRLGGDVKLLPLPEGGLIAAVELPQRRGGDRLGRTRRNPA